jgi:glycosyltransferase involved in cell wall biosynthesis
MKIAVIAASTYLSLKANVIQVMKMTEAFGSLGHEVKLALPENPPQNGRRKKPSGDWDEISELYGIRDRFEIIRFKRYPYLRMYDFALQAYRWAIDWEADLIYTRLPQVAGISSLLGKKTIFEIHDLPGGKSGKHLFRTYLRGRGASTLVIITLALKEALAEQYSLQPSGIQVVIEPDGVDLRRYRSLPSPKEARLKLETEFGFAVEKFTIGYTGHLYPGRGINLLLELASNLPEFNFLIVGGEVAEVERYRSLIDERGLDNVHLTGFISNTELPHYQAASDVLVMPYQKQVKASSGGDISRFLSPMKLFEYLACGRPIVSSNLPVLKEILDSNTAILLPPDDVAAWKSALLNLHKDPILAKELSRVSKEKSLKHSWKARAERILEPLQC